jgi:hypothetical protein
MEVTTPTKKLNRVLQEASVIVSVSQELELPGPVGSVTPRHGVAHKKLRVSFPIYSVSSSQMAASVYRACMRRKKKLT